MKRQSKRQQPPLPLELVGLFATAALPGDGVADASINAARVLPTAQHLAGLARADGDVDDTHVDDLLTRSVWAVYPGLETPAMPGTAARAGLYVGMALAWLILSERNVTKPASSPADVVPRRDDPLALAQEIAAKFVSGYPPDLDDGLEDAAAGDLFDDLRNRLGSQPVSETQPLLDRLQAALPEPLKRELITYDDLKVGQETRSRDAAYLVGVEVGRRIAGGAR